MNNRFHIAATIIVCMTLLPGCGDQSAPTGHAHTHDNEHASSMGPTNRVEIPPVVRSNLGITFAQVERRYVARTMRVPGRFELLPTARREYRVMVGGPGHVELLVDQYDGVEPHQPLFRLRSPHWTALQGEIIAAEQAISLAEAELSVADAAVRETLTRIEILRARIASLTGAEIRRADLELQVAEVEASLDRVRAERDLAEARLSSAKQTRSQTLARAAAAINLPHDALLEPDREAMRDFGGLRMLDSITVSAIEAGIVESLAVTNGSYAEDAALVLTVVNPARLRFRASMMQEDAGRIGRSREAVIVPPQSSSERAEASVTLGLEASPHQRTIDIVAQPADHRDWMRPGVSAFLEVTLEGTDRAELAIPRSALMKDGLKHVFFRRDPRDPNAAIRIEADLGPDDGRWVVIRSGLRLGDEVVLDGAYELMLATAQSGSTMQGGHFHPDGTWHADH